MLDLAAREGNEAVALQKVKDTLPQQIGDDAYMIAEVEAIPQVNTLVAIGFIVGRQSRQHTQFDPRGVAVLLNRANDFDGTARFPLFIIRLNDFAKGTLTQEFDDGVWKEKKVRSITSMLASTPTSIG